MDVLLVGNCHVAGIGRCLQAMSDVTVERVQVYRAPRDGGTWQDELARKVAAVDRVCVIESFRNIVAEAVPDAQKKMISIPHIHTRAFHPDAVYAQIDGKPFETSMGRNHSAIVLSSYLQGLSEKEALRLFHDEVFQNLGYFSEWKRTEKWAEAQEKLTGWPVVDFIRKWRSRDVFVYTANHPKLFVFSDLSEHLCSTLGIKIGAPGLCDALPDPAANGPIWPCYPDIAQRFGMTGHYLFKAPSTVQTSDNWKHFVDLEEFVQRSFSIYRETDVSKLTCASLNKSVYAELPDLSRRYSAKPSSRRRSHPYAGIPHYQRWDKAIACKSADSVDPVVQSKLKIHRNARVATAGSCFAQHISRALLDGGFNFYIAERAPENITGSRAAELQYGVYSARYGNIYTVRQLLQLFERAFGEFKPAERVWEIGEKFTDPFRPTVHGDGLKTPEEVVQDQENHLALVREMFRNLDIFVFTLGLTEAWRAKEDGSVFPLAPGVSGGVFDELRYEFVNFTPREVECDLLNFVEKLLSVNSSAKILLTVSPVPLAATYEPRHVLVSTTYSKSALRVAAEVATREYQNVFYFPSYEIITGNYNRSMFYDETMRQVKPEGVSHVMKLFIRHCTESSEIDDYEKDDLLVVCDEDRLLE